MSIIDIKINDYSIITVIWNLFLFIIPFFLCAYLAKYYKKTQFKKLTQKFWGAGIGFIWLLFLPNAAYVMTDIRHLMDYCPPSKYRICVESAWMIMFFFSYGVIGWIGIVYMINQMKEVVQRIFDEKISKYYVISIIPLISIGVLLGLINRWNSWDLFIHPLAIMQDALEYISNPLQLRNFLVFTFFFYILYWGGGFVFRRSFRGKGRRSS